MLPSKRPIMAYSECSRQESNVRVSGFYSLTGVQIDGSSCPRHEPDWCRPHSAQNSNSRPSSNRSTWGCVEFGDHVVDQDDGVASTPVELGRISLIRRASNLAWGLRKVRNTRDDLLVTLLALRGVIARFLRLDAIDIWSSRSMQARAALLILIHQRTRQSH